MAILNELRAIYLIVFRTIQDFFDNQAFMVKRYVRLLGVVFLLILGGVGAYLGYRWYVVSREQNAHQAIADYMHDYQMAVKKNTPAEWQRLDALLAFGYAQHKRSNIAPFFLVLRAQALIQQNNLIEATATLQQAIDILSSYSPIMPLLKTKRALLLLDSSEEALQKEGLKDLVMLARDKDNHYNDVVLFYLGRYYWVNNNLQDAKKVWQELVDTSVMEKAYPSPWAQEAKNMLKQIIE